MEVFTRILPEVWRCMGSVEYERRADSRSALSQWETSLQSNAVSHRLGANLESALCIYECRNRTVLVQSLILTTLPESISLAKSNIKIYVSSIKKWYLFWGRFEQNKANLRDLIAATGLVILLKFDPNHRFFSPCDLEIWWMTLENDGAPLLYYINFMHHFKSFGELSLKLQSGNAQFGSKSAIFLSCVTLKFDGWPWKTIGHLFYATSSFVHHFIPIGEFKFELQSGNAQFGSKSRIFLSRVT